MNGPQSAAAAHSQQWGRPFPSSRDPDVARLAGLWVLQLAWRVGWRLSPMMWLAGCAVTAALCLTVFRLVPLMPSHRSTRSAGWCLVLTGLLQAAMFLSGLSDDGAEIRQGLWLLSGVVTRLAFLLLLTQLHEAGRRRGVPWSQPLVAVVMVSETARGLLNVDLALMTLAGPLDVLLGAVETVVLVPWLGRLARVMRPVVRA